MTLKQKVILRRKVMKPIIKQLKFVVYVKLKRIEIVFLKLVVYVKIVVHNKFHVPFVVLLLMDLLLKNINKGYIINQFQIYSNIFKMITNYKDYMRLHGLLWIIMIKIIYIIHTNPCNLM